MEIKNLKIFLKVAELQNFTAASRELGYSQSNVSTQIQQLERDVGAPLFDRIGRKVSLTAYGEMILPHARRVVDEASLLETLLRSENSLCGTIRIGMVESLFNLYFEAVFRSYHQRCPGVHLELTVDAEKTLKDKLEKGLLDIAYLISDPLSDLQWHCPKRIRVPIVIIASAKNPLAEKEIVPLADLLESEFVLMEEDASYTAHFLQIMHQAHQEPKIILKLQNAAMAVRLTATGPYLSVLPYYAVETAVRNGQVKILRVPECQQTQEVQLVMHSGKVITPQLQHFIDAFTFNLVPVNE